MVYVQSQLGFTLSYCCKHGRGWLTNDGIIRKHRVEKRGKCGVWIYLTEPSNQPHGFWLRVCVTFWFVSRAFVEPVEPYGIYSVMPYIPYVA